MKKAARSRKHAEQFFGEHGRSLDPIVLVSVYIWVLAGELGHPNYDIISCDVSSYKVHCQLLISAEVFTEAQPLLVDHVHRDACSINCINYRLRLALTGFQVQTFCDSAGCEIVCCSEVDQGVDRARAVCRPLATYLCDGIEVGQCTLFV